MELLKTKLLASNTEEADKMIYDAGFNMKMIEDSF